MSEKGQYDAAYSVASVTQASSIGFDLSPAGLITLKESDVSDAVIKAVQARAAAEAASPAAASAPPAEPCRIFINEEDPPSRFYTVVRKEVQEDKKFYGGHDDALMQKLAKQAEKVGADAVIAFHEWRAPR